MKHQTPETITLEDLQESSRELFIAARLMAGLATKAESGEIQPDEAVAIYDGILDGLGIAKREEARRSIRELLDLLKQSSDIIRKSLPNLPTKLAISAHGCIHSIDDRLSDIRENARKLLLSKITETCVRITKGETKQ